jgi:hypothetical protein
MRLPWILFFSGLCTKVYGGDIQQVIGNSLDLSGISYTCENGMSNLIILLVCRSLPEKLGVKPSITCTDPLLHEHSCSCTCTNGLIFEQSLPSTSVQLGGSSSSSSLDACQAANKECLVREQGLSNQLAQKEQELLQREKELLAEISKYESKPPVYQGCYVEQPAPNRLLSGRHTWSESLTLEQCSTICEGYRYFGLANAGNCYCGQDLKYGATIGKDEDCIVPCNGDKSQKCGSGGRTSVYSRSK